MTSQRVYFHGNTHVDLNRVLPANATLEDKIVAALRTVYDPEIPVNLYDLGLIYQIEVNGDSDVRIKMTLTAPGCPVAAGLVKQVETVVSSILQVNSVKVELVWEPAWSQELMSDEARLELGIF